MREFRFRIYNLDEKKWDNPSILEVFYSSGELEPLYKGNYIIQQFSGITLRSAARIYEGDIISLNGLNFLCEWPPQSHGFIFRSIKDKKYIISLNETCDKDVKIEILGNIFENPELLKI